MTYFYHVTHQQDDEIFEDSGLVIADTYPEAAEKLGKHFCYSDIVSLTLMPITDPVVPFKDFQF